MTHTEVIAAVDLAAVILSCLSFIFASLLCILLWRVRRKQRKSDGKRTVILLTTHVYYMAVCDVLLSIWCIFTYGPAVLDTNFSFFIGDPLDDEMNSLSFTSIIDNLPCFLLAILGQFSAIGSATWYIMISYCLWRILYGHNPLSLTMKKKRKNKSPNANLSNPPGTNNNINKRNLKFTKNKPSKDVYKILPVKEEETMDKNDNDTLISPNQFLNLPKMLTYSDTANNISKQTNNKSVIGDHISHVYHSSNSSVWSTWSSSNADIMQDEYADYKEYQIREKQEISKILKRHHMVVWTVTILLTLVPFSTKSMGIDVSYVGDTERGLECWIGSKFWAFSFYSVISVAVLSAICMLLFISFKILKKKYKMWWREYGKRKKQKKKEELIKVYDGQGSIVSLFGRNERGSTGTSFMSSLDSNNRKPSSFYKKETMIIRRFGVFVGCYLLCWIIPIIRRYYAIFVDHESNVPDWLILGSEITIAIFPMANAFVWYTNPSFRKLISKNLNITIRYDCCCSNSNISKEIIIDRDEHNNTQLTEYDKQSSDGMKSKQNTLKESTGGISTHTTPTTYGSFCEISDMAAFSRYSWPRGNTNKSKKNDGLLVANSFPKFKRLAISNSDCNSSDNTDFDGYKNDNDDEHETSDDELSSGGTIDDNDVQNFKKYSMDQLAAKFHKKKMKKKRYNSDTAVSNGSFSSVIPPSPMSGIQKFSSSFSEEMKVKLERNKYSSDFTDNNIVAVRTHRNSVDNLLENNEMDSEYIKKLAKKCYYGSDGTYGPPQPVTQPNDKSVLHHTALTPNKSMISNSNFVNGLFSDDEEYDDKLKRFKNSIVEFEDDYGIIDESDDGLEYNQINVNENHFGPPNDT